MPLTLTDAATGLVYEIVYVTANSGAALTVLRGQEGTTAQNWNVGDYAACMHTALTTASINGNALQTFEVGAAVDGNGAVNLGQAQADFAAINGNSSEVFNVANAATSAEAVNLGQLQNGSYNYYVDTSTTTNTITIAGLPTITAGIRIVIKVANVNTGPVTINGLSVAGQSGQLLQGGELAYSGDIYEFIYQDIGNLWFLIPSGDGSVPVKDATGSFHAVNLGQVSTVAMLTNKQSFTATLGSTYSISNSFTAPCNGFILAASTINSSASDSFPPTSTNYIYINGVLSGGGSGVALDQLYTSGTNWGNVAVTAGQVCTITSTFIVASSGSVSGGLTSQTVVSIFIPNP